jgi:tripartite-type tricarboxylate transporter receptor subunit TctC
MPADGSAILQTPMSMLGIYPHIYKKLPYDPVATSPVQPGLHLRLRLRGRPDGAGQRAHARGIPGLVQGQPDERQLRLAGRRRHAALHGRADRARGVDLKHVPYRGTQPAILEMIGGQIPAVSGPVGEFTQHVAAGKARLLAASGAQRSKFAPNTPTLVEQGFKDMSFSEWFGFFLPAGASAEVINRVNAALRVSLADRETIDGMAQMGLEAKASSPAELARC